jgi:hypothetical protein
MFGTIKNLITLLLAVLERWTTMNIEQGTPMEWKNIGN